MKQRLFAALMVSVLTAGMLAGCGKTETQKKDETTQGQTGVSDKDAKDAVSEDDAEEAGFTDGEEKEANASSNEGVLLDVSKELAGLHHAEIAIKDYGTIELELDADQAPITVTNFVKLAQENFYDGLTFHRIIEDFMMQGGDPKGDGTGGSDETIKGEFDSNGVKNEISHTRGTISMARSSMPDSASSQFFICHADSDFLDGEYAAFGHVTEGMDVVDAICTTVKPQDAQSGLVAEKDQPVIETVKIID